MTYVSDSVGQLPPSNSRQPQPAVPTLTPQQVQSDSEPHGHRQSDIPIQANKEQSDPRAPQITNVADKETVYQRILLINGRAGPTDRKFETTVTVVTHGFPAIHWPCVDSHFKALVHLVPGPNTISFIMNEPNGQQHTTHFHVTYVPLTQNGPLYLVIMLASDSPATFDVPPEKRQENCLDVAIEKFRMCAYMWQAFMSEQFYRNGMGRRALRLDERFIPDTISAQDKGTLRQTAYVHVIRSRRTLKEWRDLRRAQQSPDREDDFQDLFSLFIEGLRDYGAPFDKQCTVAGLMLDSHWDVKTNVTRAHAALGGGTGDLSLGIFGSHLTHAWPRNIEDIVPAFMNTTKTDTRYVANDANESGEWWKAANIGMGAMLHEVGHAHTLTHTASGIMSRGYNNWNRTFMVKEPGLAPIPPHQENGSHWHRVDMLRLRFHRAFRIPEDGYWAPKSDVGPTFAPLASNKVTISAPAGLSMLELIVNGSYRTHLEWPEPHDQPTSYIVDIDQMKKKANCGPHERLRLEATSCNSQSSDVDNVDEFVRNHIITLPGVPGVVFKSMPLGHRGLNGDQKSSVILLPTPQRYLVSIRVHHGGFFDGMVFRWSDGTSNVLGTQGGGATEFNLKPGEYPTKFIVRSGGWVDGLQILTNTGRASPWFGGQGGGLAELEAPAGQQLVGLYATSGAWMDSIGIMYNSSSGSPPPYVRYQSRP
ncbi:hypothetical protein K450DRAFT_239280 [Umbelopsis ramanniana AG]|uniref:Jacalin-type lectin domain-containing protein n=1 Tax=Umbelopsis ramanniana AG TaxID=1314678 RepID=A0AAD5E9V5_UMBRA|nr:uncharacterized protein K450DRAFT_239280 [Umbelopsis ramanniana AG]KAI8580078.1 hypothetical protein K450DRAFT_239280 [Umbelopsis ramanniana AG]